MAVEPQRNPWEIDVEELDSLMSEGEVAVVDVREDWEWRRGHVPGAIHVPLAQLPVRLNELPRDKRLAIVCEHGNRSLAGAGFLLARGFSGTVSVSGGTDAWMRSRRPIEKDPA